MAASDKKIVAALLAFFLGTLGIHRFYLGKKTSAIIMLVLGIIGYATSWMVIGIPIIAVLGVWSLVDFILILIDKL